MRKLLYLLLPLTLTVSPMAMEEDGRDDLTKSVDAGAADKADVKDVKEAEKPTKTQAEMEQDAYLKDKKSSDAMLDRFMHAPTDLKKDDIIVEGFVLDEDINGKNNFAASVAKHLSWVKTDELKKIFTGAVGAEGLDIASQIVNSRNHTIQDALKIGDWSAFDAEVTADKVKTELATAMGLVMGDKDKALDEEADNLKKFHVHIAWEAVAYHLHTHLPEIQEEWKLVDPVMAAKKAEEDRKAAEAKAKAEMDEAEKAAAEEAEELARLEAEEAALVAEMEAKKKELEEKKKAMEAKKKARESKKAEDGKTEEKKES